jgi:hypothetical protein
MCFTVNPAVSAYCRPELRMATFVVRAHDG